VACATEGLNRERKSAHYLFKEEKVCLRKGLTERGEGQLHKAGEKKNSILFFRGKNITEIRIKKPGQK